MGPFFTRLADTLRQQGQQVWKVNFNGGDEHFFPPGERVIRFDRPLPEWPSRLRGLLSDLAIDAIVLFGQSRHMHEMAMAVGTELGLRVFVFEEGYMRPDYVTLEVGGVNAESGLPRQTEFYAALTPNPSPRPAPRARVSAAWPTWPCVTAGRCGARAGASPLRTPPLPAPGARGSRWLRGGWRKWHNRWAERHMQDFLSAPEQHKRYFLVPLQVHNDAQVTRHSRFATVAEFIVEVMASFARSMRRRTSCWCSSTTRWTGPTTTTAS
jgi:capsular polysaccharide export protein